ncbi:MAG: zinc/manganese transporter permease [Betaproteobacteria bacterium RIFCSPLOWO2_02_FULL_62_17]|nr:MAG: zinc/manganese transporter permease [Betaproteobacteria bacterium RIFCSPLOWO2_02_FULL_62_17]
MNLSSFDLGILLPALAAGLLVTATHVPLGMQVLARGIVFIDLAVAQIAGVGVILADVLGWEPHGAAVQVAAFSAALAGALLLTWTERRWPEVQEATIGVVFVLGSSAAILLLASNPQGGEHLKELLSGQILWVGWERILADAGLYAVMFALWYALRERAGRVGFYVLFACVVTVSVQLVGLYLVFATLVVPALATYYSRARRMLKALGVGVLGYVAGLAASALTDLPSGAMIVCAMAASGALLALLLGKRSGIIEADGAAS